MVPYLETVPDPKMGGHYPWSDNSTYVQKRLSAMARENGLYVVANMGDLQPCVPGQPGGNCRKDGRYMFNTNIVFDPSGRLVARYHKENLFLYENIMYDKPSITEHTVFSTPFGKFGIFTCFDILFRGPAVNLVDNYGVDNIVFTTAWMDVLPLFAAVQFHQAWPMGMRVNLLSANRHNPPQRMMGSGIYGYDGAISYHYDDVTTEGKLLVAMVPPVPKKAPKAKNTIPHVKSEIKSRHDYDFISDLFGDPFRFVSLKSRSGHVGICHNEMCCDLTYTKGNSSDTELYALGAFDGLHTKEGQYYIQVCVLLKCANLQNNSCGQPVKRASTVFQSLHLSGTHDTKHVFPELLTDGVGLAKGEWRFAEGNIVSNGLSKPLLSAALFGRVYDKDDGVNITSTSGTAHDSLSQAILAMCLFLCFSS